MSRAMAPFRALRNFAVLGACLLRASIVFIVRPAHRRDTASRARWLQDTCRRVLRGIRIRVSVRGTPPEQAVIVANHLGYLDILVLASLVPMVFVAKREVRRWPAFGWFARHAGTRFIDRSRTSDVARIGEDVVDVLDSPVCLAMFLEGTSSDGSRVLPFKTSLLEPVVRRRHPVAPAALHYTTPAGHDPARDVCYWGEMTLLPHLLRLFTLPWVQAHVVWGETRPAAPDRKTLGARLHQDVCELRILAGGSADSRNLHPIVR